MHPLLAAILGAPDGDLSHHAVYADALQAAGDPRGELIAIELALAASPGRTDLVESRAALRAEHGPTWWPGIPTQHVRTRHGFVEALAIAAEQIDLVVELARREPLRSLELRGPVPPDVLARVPSVRTLVAHELTDDAVQALCTAPCSSTLTSLDLSGSDLITFSPGAALPACRSLSIAQTWIEDHGLAAWEHIGALHELDISLPRDRYFDTHHVLAVARSLRILRASCVDDFATRETCAALAQLPALERLEVRGDGGRIDGLRAAIPAAAELVTTIPERIELDLVGDELVFTAAGEVFRNGERLPLHIRFSQADSIAYGTQVLQDAPMPAQLLVEALACGAPRILTAHGCKLFAALLPWDNRVTAELEVHATHVDLDIEHYID